MTAAGSSSAPTTPRPRAPSSRSTRGRRWSFPGTRCSVRCASPGGSSGSGTRPPTGCGTRARGERTWPPPPRSSRPSSPPGRSSPSGCGCSTSRRRPGRYRARPPGVVTGWCPSRWSSGREGPIDCTTGSGSCATMRRAATGSCSGSPREERTRRPPHPAAPHTSQARREPPQQGRPRRGWAIDTSPLRNPSYRRLFGGVAATMLGQQMTLVAVPFQVYELTRSSLLVGVTSVVALVPLIVFGLLGGAIADAMDRRRLMLITSGGAAVTSTLLAVQAMLPGDGHLAVLWVLTACVSGFAAVNQPTRSAVIPALVGPQGVAAANALAMTVRQAGVIVGPLLAGVLIGVGDIFLAYAVDAAGFLLAVLLLRGLPPLPPGGGHVGPLRLRSAVRGVGEGFSFLRTQPVLLMTFVVDIIAMLFAWPQAVFPELSAPRSAGSPNSLGWLFAGLSIGALVMGLTSGWVTRVDRQGAVVLGAIAVWG